MNAKSHVEKGTVQMGFSVTDKLGDIVASFPKAGDVFKAHKIDFCCGGNRPLFEAAAEQGLDSEVLVAELKEAHERTKELTSAETDWTQAPFADLVDYVLTEHHGYLHTTLPALGELVTTILRVHGQNHEELAKVHRLYNSLKMDFEQHLIKEETLVFPNILEYQASGSTKALQSAINAIEELEQEHNHSGDVLKQLRQVTKDYTVPQDGCGTYHYTFQKLEEVEANTFTHIHLENNILFPRLRRCGQGIAS